MFPRAAAAILAVFLLAASGHAAGTPRLAFIALDRGAMRIALAAVDGSRRMVSPPYAAAHSPGWSPDGRRLVYAASDGARWQIYGMDAGGRTPQRLTAGEGDHIFPAWAPNGRRIAYVLRRGGDEQIHTMAPDGTAARRLTTTPGRSTVPVWSPDGEWIAFVSTRDRGIPQLFVMRTDGSGVRQLSRPDAYVGNAYGLGEKTLDPVGVMLRPGMLHPAWSPDGRQIAYVTRVGRAEQQILIIARDGGTPRRLSTGYAPAWSPDGTRVAFVVARVGDSQLYVVHTDGSGLRRLTSSGANMLPVWSPDSRWLAFLAADERGIGVTVIRPDGTGRRRLGDAAGDLSMGPAIAWQP